MNEGEENAIVGEAEENIVVGDETVFSGDGWKSNIVDMIYGMKTQADGTLFTFRIENEIFDDPVEISVKPSLLELGECESCGSANIWARRPICPICEWDQPIEGSNDD